MLSSEEILAVPSIPRRLACMVYEALLLLGVVFVAGFLFGILTQTRNALENRHGLQAFIFFVLGVYFVWFWSRGQTLAMKTWHIHLRNAEGNLVSQKRALVRFLLAWLWILPPIASASLLQVSPQRTIAMAALWIGAWSLFGCFRHDRQFLHDAWAGTKLVFIKPAK